MRGLESLLRTAWAKKKMRSYEKYPVTMKFAFLLLSTSRPAFHLLRDLHLLPSQKILFNHFALWIKEAETQLFALSKLDGQIARLVELRDLPADSPIPVVIDAVALTTDCSFLPVKGSDDTFVVYGRPLDRGFKYLPLHVIQGDPGQFNAEIRVIISTVCDRLAHHGLEPKYICADGNLGYGELQRSAITSTEAV
jgi:hypothetical protein